MPPRISPIIPSLPRFNSHQFLLLTCDDRDGWTGWKSEVLTFSFFHLFWDSSQLPFRMNFTQNNKENIAIVLVWQCLLWISPHQNESTWIAQPDHRPTVECAECEMIISHFISNVNDLSRDSGLVSSEFSHYRLCIFTFGQNFYSLHVYFQIVSSPATTSSTVRETIRISPSALRAGTAPSICSESTGQPAVFPKKVYVFISLFSSSRYPHRFKNAPFLPLK